MKQLSFDAMQAMALYELYVATLVDGVQYIPADDLVTRIGNGSTKGYLLVAMRELEDRGFVTYNASAASRSSGINPEGIRHVEKGLLNEASIYSRLRDSRDNFIENTEVIIKAIPAADRLVSIDHNRPEVKEILSNIDEIEKKIRFGNDIGNFTAEEADAATVEVSQLRTAFEAKVVRIDQVMMLSKKTLKWIGEKAAGAAVGKAAIALLILIATFFGFDL